MTKSKAPEKLVVEAPALVRLLTNVKPFASTDSTLPALCGVALRSEGKQLVALATDRYGLGTDRCEASGVLPQATVSLASVKRLLVLLKGNKGLVEFTPTDDGLMVEAGRERYVLETETVEFPDLQKVLDSWQNERSASGAALNPRVLSAFTHLKAHVLGNPMRFWFYGPTKPIHVKVGDHFHGVLMPVRVKEEDLAIPAREADEPAEAVA